MITLETFTKDKTIKPTVNPKLSLDLFTKDIQKFENMKENQGKIPVLKLRLNKVCEGSQ